MYYGLLLLTLTRFRVLFREIFDLGYADLGHWRTSLNAIDRVAMFEYKPEMRHMEPPQPLYFGRG